MGFLFVLILANCFSLQLTAQDGYEIQKIKFKGNKTFSKSDLLDHVTIHETNIIQRKIQKKDASLYSDEFIETDIERLTSFYQSEGFLHVEVRLDTVEIKEKKRRVNVVFAIVENDPVKVDSVYVNITDTSNNLRPANLTRRIKRRATLKQGERFVDQTLYDDISKINTIFINRGYVYVHTDFKLGLKEKDNITDITYTITPENICQFGETTISGNKNIKEEVIRKQLNYKAGDRYKGDLLDKTRKQLYDLQLFRIVSITPQTNRETKANPIPIHIRIEEMSRLMTKFGLGYGTEDKFRAFADVTYRGLFGGTSRLNLYVKHSALTPYYVSIAWIQPQFFLKKLSVSVNPYIKRENEPGYNTQTLGLNLPFGYTLNDKITFSLSYYFERVTQHIESNDADVPNPEEERFLYNKSGLSGLFTYNNATPIFSPVKGETVTVGAKLNGYLFGGDFNYTRLWIDARKYQRIGGFTLALRAMIGAIHSSDTSGFIPVEDRFYSGGGNSNRGWARSMLGPKRESGTPLGGKSLLEMNFEIRHHLFWRIEIAAFMDISNVWTSPYYFRFNELAYAAGGGIRINTPIGPIRLDVGVPLWNEKKSVQFFLSVGQAF